MISKPGDFVLCGAQGILSGVWPLSSDLTESGEKGGKGGSQANGTVQSFRALCLTQDSQCDPGPS